jgi:hypothetical protein
LIKKTCGICPAAFTRITPVLCDFLLQCRRSLMPTDLQLLTIERSVPDEGRGLPRLLIVDDDVVQQELLKRATGRAGYEISLAASCREAIGWIRSESFDCVILDLELEDGDGTDVCKVMAETNWHRGGPPFGRAGFRPIAGNRGAGSPEAGRSGVAADLSRQSPQGSPGPAGDPRLGRGRGRPHQGRAPELE